MKNYKRQWRELSDETKERISQSSKYKPKSAAHMHFFTRLQNSFKSKRSKQIIKTPVFSHPYDL